MELSQLRLKRFGILWVVLTMVMAAAITSRPTSATITAQDDIQATIEALETEISDLRTQEASSTPSTDQSRDDVAPDGEGTSSVGGEAVATLPDGEPGEVSIIATGTYDGSILPLIIRNNTEQTVTNVTVVPVARDTSDSLIATGGDQGFQPTLLEPGDVTMGYVYFDGADLPSDTAFEHEVDAELPEDQILSRLDMTVEEASLVDDRVVGLLGNPHDEVIQGPIGIYVACFGEDGSLSSFQQGFTDSESADPGETIPFQVEVYGDASCGNFIVAASGFNF